MAANVIRFRAWLEGDLLIRAVLSLHMTDTEGLDSVESLANRTTSQIREDIKSMRRASHPAPPANNPNATIGVTARESMTIHRISKYGKYLVLVQRVHTPALGTIANLLFIGQFYDENQDLMEGDSYPLPPHPPKFNNRDGRIMMENIEVGRGPPMDIVASALITLFVKILHYHSPMTLDSSEPTMALAPLKKNLYDVLLILVLCSVATTRSFG